MNDMFYDKKVDGYKLNRFKNDPRVDIEEKHHDDMTDIGEDTLLVAKQFMVFAHLRCPKPPVRVARGLLQSTIRCQPTYYLGMNACNVLVGNQQAFYMPYTNEEWKSAKAYPVGKADKEKYYDFQRQIKSNYEASKRMGDKRTFEEYKKDSMEYYKNQVGLGTLPSLVRKNPNEHWWDKAIQDVVNLCQERGVMMNG